MKKMNFLFLFLFLHTFLSVHAQNTWFFGDHAALNFSPSPSLYTGLQPQITGNGAVSIGYDYLGNALFYTDGKSIWDKNHTLISNALNHSSSGLLDNVLVLPQPGVSNTYFIFHGEDDQLYMSKVIATSTSVTVSFINDLLYTSIDDPTDSYEHSGVGIGCITGGCKNNIGWVVIAPFDDTHNKFVAFKIDAATTNASSITNTVSIINPLRQFASPLKLSPNLQKIAYCAYGNAASTISQAILASNLIGVYDFDAISGVVSLTSPNSGVRPFINVPLPFPNLPCWFGYYGLEFSPNSNNIFISTYQGPACGGGLKSQIYQLDVSNPNWMLPAWISFIGEVNFTAPGVGQGHTKLALAPNGKIYINKPGDNDLAVINFPNALSMGTGFVNSAPGTLFNSAHAALNTWNLPNIARGNCVTPPCNITLTTSTTPDTCIAKKGTATVAATGGTGAYTYSWNTVPVQTTATATGLTGTNSYTVTVTSGTCTQTIPVTIPLVPSTMIITTASTNENCNDADGSATVNVSGGTAPFTYLWSPGGQSTATASALAHGVYTVTITDANGCKKTESVTVSQTPCLPPCTITTTLIPDTCTAKKGTATVIASGGTGSYTYSWNTVPVQTNATAIGLTGGNSYTVTVTSGTCTQTSTVNIPLITSNIILTGTPTCVPILSTVNNGNIVLTISGGTAPYTYAWSNSATTQNLLNVPSGSYSVNVTDANGCTATGTYTLACIPTCTCATANCTLKAYYVKLPSTIKNYIKCNDQIKVDCNKSFSFGAEIICPTDCVGTLNEILKDASGNVLATQPNVSTTNTLDYTFTTGGTYTLIGSFIVNGEVCKTCEIKFIVGDCPPALCVPCKTSIANISTNIIKPSIVSNTTQVDATFNFTGLPSNVTQVRAVVTSFSMYAIDANGKVSLECLPCNNQPKTWSSVVSGSSISSITPTIFNNGAEVSAPAIIKNYHNPRQITWANSGSIFTVPSALKIVFLLPLPSEYACCTLKGKVCVKFVFRNDKCEDCEVLKCFEVEIK